VPFAAGSATDQLARALGQSITDQTKQPVVVENKEASQHDCRAGCRQGRAGRLHRADHDQHHTCGQ
jgi:hypothetical protein